MTDTQDLSRLYRSAGVAGEQIARRVMEMVGILHRRGYRCLYLDAHLAPSGCCWRYFIAPMVRGRWPRSEWPYDDPLVVRGSIGGGFDQVFDWTRIESPPERMADDFIAAFPRVVEAARGRCKRYAEWYAGMLVASAPERVLVFAWDGGPNYDAAYLTMEEPTLVLPMPPGYRRKFPEE